MTPPSRFFETTRGGRDGEGNGRETRGYRPKVGLSRTGQRAPAENGRATTPGRSRQVLITGGAGFIGTNVAAHLVERGWDVCVLDNLSRPGVETNLAWLERTFGRRVTVEVADIRDARTVYKAVRRADAVFHFAAQVAVTTSLVDPLEDFDINARGTLHVLEACRRCAAPPPLLYTSTNKVYGDLGDLPLEIEGSRYVPRDPLLRTQGVSEQQPLDFHSPYGCSKGVADQYVLDYARCWNLPAVVFRMSCIYGPHQCGTEDQGWVAHFVRSVLDGEPITLYGDGRQVRDLLFADDLVAAMVRAIENIDLVRGRAFNIGGGPQNAASLQDVLQAIGELHGRTPEVRTSAWRQGDQRYYVSDTRSFEKQVGWRPRVGVEAGIRRLYEWMGRRVSRSAATA